MSESTGLEKQKEMNAIPANVLNPFDINAPEYRFYLQRLNDARDIRGKEWKEFDDLTYEVDYELNQQAKNSYLRRKKNDDEVRVNTGTTEKKIEAVENEILGMNLQPEIVAYDQDDLEIKELGQDIADIVKRTNQIEKDDDFWQEAVEELLTQRAVFVEELWVDKEVDHKTRLEKRKGKKKQTIYKEGSLKIQRAEKRVLCGLQVYLGDPSIPAYLFQTQPYIVKYERMSYVDAATIYGEWEMWKYVKTGNGSSDEYGLNYKWRFGSLLKNEVEILHYMCYPDDEYQIIINGVMMFEPGEPLPWEHEGYNMVMTNLKSLTRYCSYGKPLTASAKTLQALDNETIRNLIRKFRQAIEPPIGVKVGKVFSKDIWSPAAITQGVGKEDFSRLIDHDGVTNSEFAMMDLITRKTEEFIGQASIAPQKGKKPTATQILETQKQAIKLLGLAVYAVMRLKRDMTYLRIDTVLEEYTQPVGKILDAETKKIKDTYRKFTINEGTFENGLTGKKVVHFMDRDLTPDEEKMIYDYEEKRSALGEPIRIKTINAKKLQEVPVMWNVTVNAQDRDGSALSKAMFQDKLTQAGVISQMTQRQVNPDKVIQSFEDTWKAKDWFPNQAPAQGGDAKAQAQELLNKMGKQPGSPGSDVLAAQAPQPPQAPTVNTMLQPA